MPLTDPQGRWRPSPFLWFSAAVHVGAVGAVASAPATWPLAAAAVFADHLALAAAGMTPRSRLLGPNLTRTDSTRSVALTFDDGPEPSVTPRVLDLLDGARARASFFCIGRLAAAEPKLVAEIAARGHRVENHSFSHSYGFAMFGPRRLAGEVDRAQRLLTGITGRQPRYFRAPAGMRSPLLEPLLARRSLTLASWTRRGFDAVDRDADRVSRRLGRGLAGGDILLLHDGRQVERPSGDPPPVLEVLPRLLSSIDAAGLDARPLPE